MWIIYTRSKLSPALHTLRYIDDIVLDWFILDQATSLQIKNRQFELEHHIFK